MLDLSPFPRVSLGHLPTPLQPLRRLSSELGGPMIWMKRDDCTGLALGGNKTRKLEYLMAEALQQEAELIVTFGALQSNHVRQTVAACAQLGLPVEVILSRSVPMETQNYQTSGNLLLDELMGARVHRVHPDAVRQTYQDLKARESRRVYAIPTGGSNATGALGYVNAALELSEQIAALKISPAALIHASSSAGTQAGLVVGMANTGKPLPVLGINVYDKDLARIEASVHDLVAATAERVGSAAINPASVQLNHDYIGEAYGLPTPEMLEAVSLLATLEGILLDPVYSGKAMAALIGQVRAGDWADAEDLVFLHTGGAPALFAYVEALADGT